MRTLRLCVGLLAISIASSCGSSKAPRSENGSVRAPTLVQRIDPEYPAELRRQHVEGGVVIGGTVPKEGGTLRNPHVVRSSDPRLNQLALEAVSHWMWTPALSDGQPVDVEFITEVRFSVHP
jgi:protein TonB